MHRPFLGRFECFERNAQSVGNLRQERQLRAPLGRRCSIAPLQALKTDRKAAEKLDGTNQDRPGSSKGASNGEPTHLEGVEEEHSSKHESTSGLELDELDNGGKFNLLQKWEKLPAQYKMVFSAGWAFVICNMDKVNISVAIIEMSKELHWSQSTAGIVQSSFFAGYMMTQIPGGYVVGRLGGSRVLPAGVVLWSAATAATPLLAATLPGMLACRVLVGLGEGVAPTSATDLVARGCKQSERGRATGFIFSGLHVGSLAGLLVAPYLIENFGWPSVFYIFGVLGILWSAWWEKLVKKASDQDPRLVSRLEDDKEKKEEEMAEQQGRERDDTPWRAFLRNTPIRALTYVHFCNNWNAFVMTAWLPTYFSDSLHLTLTQASQAALFPPIAAIAASAAAGPAVDLSITNGLPVGPVRKSAQAVAFLGPAAFLGLVCKYGGGSASNEMLTVGLVSAALGLASCSVAGLYSNHADLSPRHAPLLLGVTNTAGAMPGIIGVTLTGVIFDRTHDWNLALFAPSIFFLCTGFLVFLIWGSAEEQKFDDDSPFWFEKHFSPATSRLGQIPVASTSSSVFSKISSMWKQIKP